MILKITSQIQENF